MKCIEAKVEGHIAQLTLKRPESANALSQAMLDEILMQLEEWKYDSQVRAMIITGDGEKVFCAGADLKERKGMDAPAVKKAVTKIGKMVTAVEEMPIPVIAAINGAAFGGGLELALACDLRIASNNATFALTETSLGIIPGAGGTQRLPRAIGEQRAKEMIFTGKRIDASLAHDWGLIIQVTTPKQLLDKATELAKEITKNGPIAVKQAKLAINAGRNVDLRTGLVIEKNAYEITIPTEDRLEGLQAFKEKRKPNFKGE
ncbi:MULTISPECIES: enoyl-CoA hydratase [Bacillaceae]|uniref:Enoyl-CoA hydratase n=1 Tax=Evansella alkalicola TaxID=745819 RepID=A0ABS6JQC5_9BACI|nr:MULTISPECIES: enoyl-CoA hydratase [Bacillaceae]MBU9720754.1 enoyl-CoA hydratase [Bacillus alkalicola]